MFSDVKYTLNVSEDSLDVKNTISLAAFQVFSLTLNSLNMMCLYVEHFELSYLELIDSIGCVGYCFSLSTERKMPKLSVSSCFIYCLTEDYSLKDSFSDSSAPKR